MRNKVRFVGFFGGGVMVVGGLAWISSGGVDLAIVAVVTGDVQGGDGRHWPRLVVVVCLVSYFIFSN